MPLSHSETAAVVLGVIVLANLVWVTGETVAGPRRYEARVELLVGTARSIDDARYHEPRAAAGIAEVFGRLATSPVVLAQVAENLHIEATVQDLASRIRVETVLGSRFFAIEVADPDPSTAALIANQIAGILVSRGAADSPARQILLVAEAAVPPAPTSNTGRMAVAVLAGVVAAAIGLAIVILPTGRRPRIRPVSMW